MENARERAKFAEEFNENPIKFGSLDGLVKLFDNDITKLLIDWEQVFEKYLLSGDRDAAGYIVGEMMNNQPHSDDYIKGVEMKRKLIYFEINNALPGKPVIELYELGKNGTTYYYGKHKNKMGVFQKSDFGMLNKTYDLIVYTGDQVPEDVKHLGRMLEHGAGL
ncbi:hypothetical protein ACFL1H_02660 [Nanoarchaeota archaeon]